MTEDQPQLDDLQLIDFSNTKKTKKTKKKTKEDKKSKAEKAAEAGTKPKKEVVEEVKQSLNQTEGHVDYSYQDLLSRIITIIKEKNPSIAEGVKATKGVAPDVVRIGTTKTSWMNFNEMVEAMDRKHEHVMSFISSELGAEASLGPVNNLILQGKFAGKNIEILYKRYLKEYVVCSNCLSQQTKLDKDPTTRLYVLECKQCGANRTVAAIKAGFHAIKRGERKKARE